MMHQSLLLSDSINPRFDSSLRIFFGISEIRQKQTVELTAYSSSKLYNKEKMNHPPTRLHTFIKNACKKRLFYISRRDIRVGKGKEGTALSVCCIFTFFGRVCSISIASVMTVPLVTFNPKFFISRRVLTSVDY